MSTDGVARVSVDLFCCSQFCSEVRFPPKVSPMKLGLKCSPIPFVVLRINLWLLWEYVHLLTENDLLTLLKALLR